MTKWVGAFPYAVADWETVQSNNWRAITKWLDQNLPDGRAEWDYADGEYRFKTEHAKMLFLLRWA